MHFRLRNPALRPLALTAICLLAAGVAAAGDPPSAASVMTGPASVSAPVTPSSFDGDIRDLPPPRAWKPGDPIREIPRRFYPDAAQELAHAPPWHKAVPDPLIARQAAVAKSDAVTAFGTPIINIAGNPNGPFSPPDVAGDVGASHYIQATNGSGGSLVQIYNKATGAAIGPGFLMVSLGGTGDCASASGDPIVLYDRLADRWFLLDFVGSPIKKNTLCAHVSKTADPVAGGWWNYTFDTALFPDYPHCGVWWNAYYCTANTGGPTTPVYAYDRARMLTGAAATQQTFFAPGLAGYGFQALTPVNFLGATAPPAGAEFLLMRHNDDEAHAGGGADGAKDFLDLFALRVDWAAPANSTFTTLPVIDVAEFNSWLVSYTAFASVPQPGSTAMLDPIREVILNKLNYRRFPLYESVVGAYATNLDPARTGTVVKSGVRWFEVRKSAAGGPWTLFQEGTYGDASGTKHALQGAPAMDQSGNIALGFTLTQTSAPNIFASMMYSGRLAADPPGTMPQGENTVILGVEAEDSGRWGDYPSMGVDPVDDCTFWFTHEYRPAGGWATQIASFKFDSCGACAPPGAVGNSVNAAKAGGGTQLTFTWTDIGGATGYNVYEDAGPNGPFTTVTGAAASGNPGLTVNLPAGNFFRIAATNACGPGPK